MQWRNREKRNDQEHYVKASFFHLAEKILFLRFLLLVMLFVLKKCLFHFLLLVMLFAPAAKRSNSCLNILFKTGVLKIFAISQENICVGAAF